MSLKNVYHFDGTTKTSILPSVIKLTARQGVFPDFGGITAELTYPVLDSEGNEVTLAKGDVIWSCTEYSTNLWFTHGMGIINDLKRSGDFITVKAESMMEPLLRMRYTIDNGLGAVTAHLLDIISSYTPPHGLSMGNYFPVYRRETGPETWALDCTLGFLVHNMEVDVRAMFQYLTEQPPNPWLGKPTGCIFPVYEYNDNVGTPSFDVGYTAYGNHRSEDLVLSRDTGILSDIEWMEPTESILNDVTITVRGGASEQYTDPASIALYGKRQTTLARGIFSEGALGGYDATQSIEAIVDSMAVPHKRCRLTCDIDAILNTWGHVGFMYRVIDDITGEDEYMALRSFTYRYPEEVAECEFDNAPLDMSKYGLRMENRVTSLEANMVSAHANFFDLQGGSSPSEYYHLSQAAYNNLYQQDQAVKTTDSPRFNALNIGADCQLSRAGADLLYTPDALQLAGGVFAGANSTVGGALSIFSSWSTVVAQLNLTRGANASGWNYRLAFNPYIGDGALSDSKPAWYFMGGYSSHELNVQHWNGSTASTVMQFLVDKSINIVNGLTVGSLATAGAVSAGSLLIPGSKNTTITNEGGTGAIRIDAGSNGYVTVGPLNSSACHIYTDRAVVAFDKTVLSAGANSDLGSTTHKWRHCYMTGDLNAGAVKTGLIESTSHLYIKSANQHQFYSAGVNIATINNAGLFYCGGVSIGGTTVLSSATVTTPKLTLGSGGPNLEGVGADTIRLATGTKLTQAGFQFLGPSREIYGTSYPFNCTASANYRNTHDAEKYFTWAQAMMKQKTITLTNGLGPGTYRVYFEMKGANYVSYVRGQVYKNGAPMGTYRAHGNNSSYVAYSETFSGPLEPGTTIELWCYQNGGDGNGGYCRNFRIGYDLGLPSSMPSSNS